jgi:hypothetical protein
MAVQNVPQRSGRRRGHQERALVATRNRRRLIAPAANARGRFALRPVQASAEGRVTRLAAPATLRRNRGNPSRKPSARRTSPFKQLMRKQTISPQVAKAMREEPAKGDRRRSQAERKVRIQAERRIRARATNR